MKDNRNWFQRGVHYIRKRMNEKQIHDLEVIDSNEYRNDKLISREWRNKPHTTDEIV